MYEQILKEIYKVYANKKLTNCMLPVNVIEQGLRNGNIIIAFNNPILLIQKNESFRQLFYFMENESSVSALDSGIIVLRTNLPTYADITLKGDFDFEGSIFERLNFLPYRTYVRKRAVNTDIKQRKMLDTAFCVMEDKEQIIRMLNEQFDLMADHIPNSDELEEMISKQQILKISINNDLAGVLLFEDTGKRSYARALCVAPKYQNSFVGYSLLADYFYRHDEKHTKVFELWVDENNNDVKKLHDRFGYKLDGLKNYIFRRIAIDEEQG